MSKIKDEVIVNVTITYKDKTVKLSTTIENDEDEEGLYYFCDGDFTYEIKDAVARIIGKRVPDK